MMSFKQLAARTVLTLAGFAGVFGVLSLGAASEAKADPFHHHHHHHSFGAQIYVPQVHVPHYHAPSVHFHRTYHPDFYHWTPSRGFHSHGHFHVEPHYTPGHFHW
jgi:hypothetical protein